MHTTRVQPDSKTEFFCPVRKKNVRWEEKDVFNPAAVVREKEVMAALPGAGSYRTAGRHFPHWFGVEPRWVDVSPHLQSGVVPGQ